MKDLEPEEMDYILQVLSNRIRREVIRILARESPLSYSALMKRVGVDDSGTFGFHIRKMQRLIKKDDMGEYMLNELGRKAYEILTSLMDRESSVERGEAVSMETGEGDKEAGEEPSTITISSRIRFDLTEDIARTYREKGNKIYLTDIVKLRIHPMPRDLFDEVVEGIHKCIDVEAPKELLDIVESKSSGVLKIQGYRGKRGGEVDSYVFNDMDGFVGELVSRIISATSAITNRLVSSGWGFGRMFGSTKQELIIDEHISIPRDSRMTIDLSGGILEVKPGDEGRIRVWKTGWRNPDVDIDVQGDSIHLEVGGGKCELTIPGDAVKDVYIDVNGGLLSLKIPGLETIDLDISGGMARIDSSSDKPVNIDISMNGGAVSGNIYLEAVEAVSKIKCDLNGGVTRLGIRIPDGVKVSVDNKLFGGYASIQLNGRNIHGKYVEEGFGESSGKLIIYNELMGGLLTMDIKRGPQ